MQAGNLPETLKVVFNRLEDGVDAWAARHGLALRGIFLELRSDRLRAAKTGSGGATQNRCTATGLF